MFLNASITVPRYPAGMIDRPRLYRQLDRWSERRAIAIHAPTGYGKSSLVSRWIDHAGLASQAAWLSLQEGDSDVRQFVHHVVAALDRVVPGALALAQPILEDSQGDAERVLMRLFSMIWGEAGSNALPGNGHTLLVLDDLHRVQSAEVDQAILTILEQGPDNLHVLLLARQRTTLPLARLYAHEKIVALEAEDLRFTTEEVREYLQRLGFPHLTETEVAQLETRSEGWVTALQLGVLALHGDRSVGELIRVLRGENVWLAAYLTDEVLNRQTPELRRFLLQTSILDEFNAELCAAVTGDAAAHARLDEIARGNLFLIQLGETEKWFRYHHLFQELLQYRLHAQTGAVQVADLHRRAAAWLAGAGRVPGAVRHLLAAGDGEQAATLVESRMRATLLRHPYEAQTLLALLPYDLLVQRPQLMLDRCRLAALFDDQHALTHAQEAERTLQQQQADPDAARHHAEWLVLRAGAFFMQRDLAGATEGVRQAQAYLTYLDDFHFGILRFLQMHLHSYEGRRAEMVQPAEDALAAFERAGFASGAAALRRQLARWSMAGGNSGDANRRFRELLEEEDRDRVFVKHELTLAYAFAAENSYWQDELAQAQAYQRSCMALAIQLQDPELIHVARYLGQALGMDTGGVGVSVQAFLTHLNQVKSIAVADLLLDWEISFLVAAGQADMAWRIVQQLGINPQNSSTYRERRKWISYLRAAIACGCDLAALTPALADSLTLAVRADDRFGQLQLLALTAWQQLQLFGAESARATLKEAAHLARETGYVRVLLDIPALAPLLTAARWFDDTTAATSGKVKALLTEQEQAVLALLAGDRTYAEIADALVISVNTVRTHVRHIYEKLGVHRRDQAIRWAHALDLAR